MNHSSNESLSKLEFKNDFISDFAKNKLVEVVRVTNDLYTYTYSHYKIKYPKV